jgi:hypothetical protein
MFLIELKQDYFAFQFRLNYYFSRSSIPGNSSFFAKKLTISFSFILFSCPCRNSPLAGPFRIPAGRRQDVHPLHHGAGHDRPGLQLEQLGGLQAKVRQKFCHL